MGQHRVITVDSISQMEATAKQMSRHLGKTDSSAASRRETVSTTRDVRIRNDNFHLFQHQIFKIIKMKQKGVSHDII